MAISDALRRKSGFPVSLIAFRLSQSLLKFLFVLLLIMPLSGCSRQHIAVPDHAPNAESSIIVVPGYYGTRLVHEADSSPMFISVSEALFGDQSLTLPIPGLGFEKTTALKPADILDKVSVVPFVYSIDVYGSLLDRLGASGTTSREVIPFTYDWRGDLIEAVRSLDVLIHRLRADGKKEISIVAHSMGGLIVSYYMRYGTQDIADAVETWKGVEAFQGVVLVGVPFLGVMNSFRNMNFGVTVGWNSSLLSSEAYSSFPASYYTLPVAEIDELLRPEGKPIKGVIRDAEQWRESEWGLLKNKEGFSNDIVVRRARFTSLWLHRSQQFLELLQAPLSTPSPYPASLLYVYGKGTSTLNKGVWAGNQGKGPDALVFADPDQEKSVSPGNFPNLYADGDGTVTVSSAWLPVAYRQTFQTTIRNYEVGHTELVTTPDIQDDIMRFLDSR